MDAFLLRYFTSVYFYEIDINNIIDLVVGNRSFSINFSAKITTNKKDIASSDLKIYNDISDVEDIVLLL